MNPNIGEVRYQPVSHDGQTHWDSWKVVEVDDKFVKIQFAGSTELNVPLKHKGKSVEKRIPLDTFDKIFKQVS